MYRICAAVLLSAASSAYGDDADGYEPHLTDGALRPGSGSILTDAKGNLLITSANGAAIFCNGVNLGNLAEKSQNSHDAVNQLNTTANEQVCSGVRSLLHEIQPI
jgi:hypothetical protein